MIEPTYTEAEIATAMMGLGIKKVPTSLVGEVLERLKRPKHDFAEGQVAYNPNCNEYFLIDDLAAFDLFYFRHLNMTELGPHVKALRDALVYQGDFGGSPEQAKRDVKAFDAAVGESDE